MLPTNQCLLTATIGGNRNLSHPSPTKAASVFPSQPTPAVIWPTSVTRASSFHDPQDGHSVSSRTVSGGRWTTRNPSFIVSILAGRQVHFPSTFMRQYSFAMYTSKHRRYITLYTSFPASGTRFQEIRHGGDNCVCHPSGFVAACSQFYCCIQ